MAAGGGKSPNDSSEVDLESLNGERGTRDGSLDFRYQDSVIVDLLILNIRVVVRFRSAPGSGVLPAAGLSFSV